MSQPQKQGEGTGKATTVSSVSAPTISLPKGGGAIRGIGEKFAANPVTGTGSMTVPIATSPGRSGFGPQLSLSYDSGSGNGPFGLGWSLSLPQITRKTDKGLPRYRDAEESDEFILSGAEDLVPVFKRDVNNDWVFDNKGRHVIDEVERNGYLIRRYRPRIEGLFARIERWTHKTAPEKPHWCSISRDNITTLYGRTENSRIGNPIDSTRVFSWLISDSYDDKGNAIHYVYKEENSIGFEEASPLHERNRNDGTRKVNRYLQRILYGNRIPYSKNQELPDSCSEWLFEVVFDYTKDSGEDAQIKPISDLLNDQIRPWGLRLDPFSTYRAGFEVRTYRLCHRVLMFHHFKDELGIEDYLVGSTDFAYQEDPIASFITEITQSGYVLKNGKYLKKSLPPLEFGYSKAEIQEDIREVDHESLENLPIGLDGSQYQWVDLDGEGVSGILTEQADVWYYKPNRGDIRYFEPDLGSVRFGPLEKVKTKPSLASLSGGQQLLDLAGDGQLDLVDFSGPVPGFYERTQDQQWEQFTPFTSLPNIRWNDPNLKFVDLTGDGHADVLITEDQVLTWYPSKAEEGFDPCEVTPKANDENIGPRLVFNDGTQSIYLADLSGDGLTDLARVRNGEICYWPNLGYGRFGAKVTMDNAPWFDNPDQFSQQRLRLADIDGSGTTDIIYLGRDEVKIYRNWAGNSWSNPESLKTFPPVDNLSSVLTVDLLGNGTACLVWSSPLPNSGHAQMRYIALMEEKPHLLTEVKNNLGAETVVKYAPSTKFYLKDKAEGKPWITKLPFPVHVVERVETHDHVSGNRFVTRYAYHHGYFDGVEREFRGFGMVEQWDTEEFIALKPNRPFPSGTNYDEASHVPPVLTRTWFHTGAWIEGGKISKHFQDEYYREGDPSRGEGELKPDQLSTILLPDTVLPDDLSIEEIREACRALKGSILRQEVYALDKKLDGTPTEESDRPYTVSERNYTIIKLQPIAANEHAVFFVHPCEQVDFHYERKLFLVADGKLVDPQSPPPNAYPASDPRVTHALTLKVDNYGNVLQSGAIGYGRRFQDPSLTADDQEKQKDTQVTYTENIYANAVLEGDAYRTPLLCESRTYEVLNFKLDPLRIIPDVTNLFTFNKVIEQIEKAGDGKHDIPYEDIDHNQATTNDPFRRLIEHVRTLYRKDDLTGPCALGQIESMALPYESYKLAFTPGLVKTIFVDSGKLPAADVDRVFGTEGGYVHSQGDANWWIPSGRIYYSSGTSDTPAQELACARGHFFLTRRYRDPFHTNANRTETFVDYDPHDLLVRQTRDALGNRVTVGKRKLDDTLDKDGNDYRMLQPCLMMDPNRNCSEVAFDALGLVVGTAVMGKPEDNPPKGDLFDASFKADLIPAEISAFFNANDPHVPAPGLLGNASTRIVYDLDSFRRSYDENPQDPSKWAPVFASTLARETHVSDGFPPSGLKIQISFSYSDGFGREIQKKIQAEKGPVPKRDGHGRIIVKDGYPEMTDNAVEPRWVGSGWTIFNNKGKPVCQFEPFFSNTHHFDDDVRIGVSPILFYDPVVRVVATLHPNHTYEKVVFDPWLQTTWDVNDTVLILPQSDPDVSGYIEKTIAAMHDFKTWFDQIIPDRHNPPVPPGQTPEQDAALKATVHADTPTVAHLDTLGRTVLTYADNGPDPAQVGQHLLFATRVNLDIEGNQREVVDAKGRIVMRYDYDMLGNRVHRASMEAGQRWMLNDVAGKPIYAWDSRDHSFRTAYDPLRRPTGLFVTENSVKRLAERTIYGEAQGDANNHKSRVYQVFDGAGVMTSEIYDFKGNLRQSKRDLLPDYQHAVDWQQNPVADAGTFATSTEYDALNRPTTVTTPDGSVYRPSFNEANLLDKVDVNLRGAPAATPFVTNIDYNEKGQRVRVEYKNGATTEYGYDPKTFRLTDLKTTRPAGRNGLASIFADPTVVQDLRYTYDPVGNITRMEDKALKSLIYNNGPIEPVCNYRYDAIYRLIEAKGREHIGQTAFDFNPPNGDYRNNPFVGHRHPNDLQALRVYTENYEYDAVGNFKILQHVAKGGDWTRSYDYLEASPIEPAKQSNRLTRTTLGNGLDRIEPYSYDDHGNIVTMPHLPLMLWDFRDQLQATSRQSVSNGRREMAYYVYDAAGQRVRKVTANPQTRQELENGDQPKRMKERIYLGGYEIYREYDGTGQIKTLERETLHIMDDKQRIALVETKTVESGNPVNNPVPLQRYQLSNHLGSSSVELDKDGALISYEEYHPYGTTAFQAGPTAAEVSLKRYRYTGKERDEENGLYYHGARYYAPWVGRWTSCDPAELADSLSLYVYVRSGPIHLSDSTGMQSDSKEELVDSSIVRSGEYTGQESQNEIRRQFAEVGIYYQGDTVWDAERRVWWVSREQLIITEEITYKEDEADVISVIQPKKTPTPPPMTGDLTKSTSQLISDIGNANTVTGAAVVATELGRLPLSAIFGGGGAGLSTVCGVGSAVVGLGAAAFSLIARIEGWNDSWITTGVGYIGDITTAMGSAAVGSEIGALPLSAIYGGGGAGALTVTGATVAVVGAGVVGYSAGSIIDRTLNVSEYSSIAGAVVYERLKEAGISDTVSFLMGASASVGAIPFAYYYGGFIKVANLLR